MATWQNPAPCKQRSALRQTLGFTAWLCARPLASGALALLVLERSASFYVKTHIKTFVGTHICGRRVVFWGVAPPGRKRALCASHFFRGRSVRSSASGGSLPAPSLVVVVMAAAASLSPEDLLPKGSAGKAEEMEDELEDDDDDEELDETLAERLWGLTEMFPESVRSAAGATFDLSLAIAQKMYRFSRAALWIGTTSFMILVLPVVFETEKLQMEQQQQLQQRQILLGPNTGLSGGMPGALPPLSGKI
ncbi:mitochondrial import receptor subunit TOM22 homolog [Numida meleagris]|uniref:mitochondrial import receptor subunit TOM22 homolog n=1 Tax=Numida meleagris TaxID=8996 RepID=UPI000B3E02D2|nr:mitochondrial import receptor subunit TOM22 homolog [Numida meleagris]